MGTFGRQLPPKSETREMAEQERIKPKRLVNEPTNWDADTGMKSSTFFIAFVIIAAGLAVAALLLR